MSGASLGDPIAATKTSVAVEEGVGWRNNLSEG